MIVLFYIIVGSSCNFLGLDYTEIQKFDDVMSGPPLKKQVL